MWLGHGAFIFGLSARSQRDNPDEERILSWKLNNTMANH
jgi:hypothetical protein